MGKHNGKARKSGSAVGAALIRSQAGGPSRKDASERNVPDHLAALRNGQSVVEEDDLSQLMSMAHLAGRDFAGVQGEVVVLSSAASRQPQSMSLSELRNAEARHVQELKIPRRPRWEYAMTAEDVDASEKAAFLQWRRSLARLEDDVGLVLTPFERNLDVWRQLWRVVERSDSLVQVLDARDPLFYRCADLERYAREVNPNMRLLLLLNKADLVPQRLRSLWADFFDREGIGYAFFAATANRPAELPDPEGSCSALLQRGDPTDDQNDLRTAILDPDGLVQLLEDVASSSHSAERGGETAQRGGEPDIESGAPVRRLPTVGLVGYPNVGKSSTINAVFGSKRTAVAPTPGKTKHFQTLHVKPGLVLCDCPGLVPPRLARSKADMVAAGVVPIDRLTDVHGPVGVVLQKISPQKLHACIGLEPKIVESESASGGPTASSVLKAYAAARGWLTGSGLADEGRAGRALLRDYTSGRLPFCEWPPGLVREDRFDDGMHSQHTDSGIGYDRRGAQLFEGASLVASEQHGTANLGTRLIAEAPSGGEYTGASTRPVRPDYKFHKKPTKHRLSGRAYARSGVSPYDVDRLMAVDDDVQMGKRGGIKRVEHVAVHQC